MAEEEPRQLNKREQKFCTQLEKWWVNKGVKEKDFCTNNIKTEAKVSVDDRPFNYKSGFKPHQLPTMMRYNIKPMAWKISDLDTISTKHYDISLDNPAATIAFIAIMWVRRGNKTFYLINPEMIYREIEDGKKSLTEQRAKEIADYIGTVR